MIIFMHSLEENLLLQVSNLTDNQYRSIMDLSYQKDDVSIKLSRSKFKAIISYFLMLCIEHYLTLSNQYTCRNSLSQK